MQCMEKVEVAKAKQKAYIDLLGLDSKEGINDLDRLVKQRDRDGKDVQVRGFKDVNENVLTGAKCVMGGWKAYSEELINEEN